MNITDLPTTEWWDPEWDVYDVPHTPNEGWWQDNPTPEQCDTWWAAYEHLWNIRWVMCGSAEYRPDFRGRELTQHAYPGQPATRTRPPTKPCTCWYEVKDIRTSRGMYQPPRLVHGTGFTIEPTCPHHGDPARTVPIEELWNDPWLNVARDPYDLDDNERTNH